MLRFHIRATSLDKLKSSALTLKQLFELQEQRITELSDSTEAIYLAERRNTERTLVMTTDQPKPILLPKQTWRKFKMDDSTTIFVGRGFDIFTD
ncbi:hypothetical protein J2Z48_001351 [Croceifilum oryzae]|uniref:Uncharacterized protein n=1 Tax=Croceifilum oryzae TaxID=1553429 RepID=A0AAJ1TEV4_9BACL|nr:hypothetical protein [Croceifilum oryzae]MDQ0417179.1 hypothetical protein [Croceifilum oryzae]